MDAVGQDREGQAPDPRHRAGIGQERRIEVTAGIGEEHPLPTAAALRVVVRQAGDDETAEGVKEIGWPR